MPMHRFVSAATAALLFLVSAGSGWAQPMDPQPLIVDLQQLHPGWQLRASQDGGSSESAWAWQVLYANDELAPSPVAVSVQLTSLADATITEPFVRGFAAEIENLGYTVTENAGQGAVGDLYYVTERRGEDGTYVLGAVSAFYDRGWVIWVQSVASGLPEDDLTQALAVVQVLEAQVLALP